MSIRGHSVNAFHTERACHLLRLDRLPIEDHFSCLTHKGQILLVFLWEDDGF